MVGFGGKSLRAPTLWQVRTKKVGSNTGFSYPGGGHSLIEVTGVGGWRGGGSDTNDFTSSGTAIAILSEHGISF